MINPVLFECRYGKGAFDRLRSMLNDSTVAYERIAKTLGLTKQRIGQLANDLGVDGRNVSASAYRAVSRILRRGNFHKPF